MTQAAASPHLPETLVVIQPTAFCNINCSYCYLPGRDATRKMSDQVLGAIADEVFGSALLSGELSFVWHAGEPLTAGYAFFERAFTTIASHSAANGRQISHSVQTNGLLLDERWLKLLARYDVRLGLSVDGPAFLHDRNRKTRSGKGTHAAVMRAVDQLRQHGYPFSAIMVVTREALEHADEVFEFFAELGASYVGLNVEEIESANVHSSLDFASSDGKLREFYRCLLERQQSEGRVRFREFDPYQSLLQRSTPFVARSIFSRSSLVVPFSIVNFDVAGNFSTFCPELLGSDPHGRFANFEMGNVLRDHIDAIPQHPIFKQVHLEIVAGVRKCEDECGYWKFCGGGNPANKYFESGRFDVSETSYCRQHKQRVVDAVLDVAEARASASA